MLNDVDLKALSAALGKLDMTKPLLVTEIAAALDVVGITGFVHADPEETDSYLIRVEVEVEMFDTTPQKALEWANEHTVFDMLDRGATISSPTIHNMMGEEVTPDDQ